MTKQGSLSEPSGADMDEDSAAGGPMMCERSMGNGGANERGKEAHEAGKDGVIMLILILGC